MPGYSRLTLYDSEFPEACSARGPAFIYHPGRPRHSSTSSVPELVTAIVAHTVADRGRCSDEMALEAAGCRPRVMTPVTNGNPTITRVRASRRCHIHFPIATHRLVLTPKSSLGFAACHAATIRARELERSLQLHGSREKHIYRSVRVGRPPARCLVHDDTTLVPELVAEFVGTWAGRAIPRNRSNAKRIQHTHLLTAVCEDAEGSRQW